MIVYLFKFEINLRKKFIFHKFHQQDLATVVATTVVVIVQQAHQFKIIKQVHSNKRNIKLRKHIYIYIFIYI